MTGERLARLEVRAEHLETSVGALSSKIDDVLTALRPLASKAYVWRGFVALGAFIAAVVTYAPQLQKLMAWLSGA